MRKLNKKSIILIGTILIGWLVFCLISFSKNLKSGEVTNGNVETTVTEQVADDTEIHATQLYEDDTFTFTANQIQERFMDTLPENYKFAHNISTNSLQKDSLQIEILKGAGEFTGVTLLLDTKEDNIAFDQLALIINEGAKREDVAIIMRWYISTFLDSFDIENQNAIIEAYLDSYYNASKEIVMYSSEKQITLICSKENNAKNIYYVMISIR